MRSYRGDRVPAAVTARSRPTSRARGRPFGSFDGNVLRDERCCPSTCALELALLERSLSVRYQEALGPDHLVAVVAQPPGDATSRGSCDRSTSIPARVEGRGRSARAAREVSQP